MVHPNYSKAIYGGAKEGRGKRSIDIISCDISCVYEDGCDCLTCNNSVWRLAKQKPLYAQSTNAYYFVSPEDFICDIMAGDQRIIGTYKQVSNFTKMFMQRPPTPVRTQYYEKCNDKGMALGHVVHVFPTPDTIRKLPS